MASIFETLNSVNVSNKTEKKNGLTYLSWAWAWGEVKKVAPDATYTIYERETEYGPVNYFTDGRTCWVKTGLTINGLEHIEDLPVMDSRNRSIPLENVTSFDVNKAIQRSLTKAAARHGLGLYIYAGEDLPEEEGSAEAARTVGEQKLKRMGGEVEQKPAANEPLAAPGQLMFIREHMDALSSDELSRMIKTYGEQLERMTYTAASKVVSTIQKRESA